MSYFFLSFREKAELGAYYMDQADQMETSSTVEATWRAKDISRRDLHLEAFALLEETAKCPESSYRLAKLLSKNIVPQSKLDALKGKKGFFANLYRELFGIKLAPLTPVNPPLPYAYRYEPIETPPKDVVLEEAIRYATLAESRGHREATSLLEKLKARKERAERKQENDQQARILANIQRRQEQWEKDKPSRDAYQQAREEEAALNANPYYRTLKEHTAALERASKRNPYY